MICKNCNKKVNYEDKFCVNCGYKLENRGDLVPLNKTLLEPKNKIHSIFRNKWITKFLNLFYIPNSKKESNNILISDKKEIEKLEQTNNILQINKCENYALNISDNSKYFQYIPKNILELLWIKDYNDYQILEGEPSLIDFELDILESKNIDSNEKIGYYPSYRKLTPEQRFVYLNWLKDITKPIDIGYVFIFYYGLERHLLFGEFEKAFDTIMILRKYHFNKSFLSYSENALLASIIKRDRLDYINKLNLSKSNINIFALIISKAFKKFMAEDLILFSTRVGFSNKRYIKEDYNRFVNEMKNILIQEYEEEYYPINEEYFLHCQKTFSLMLANTLLCNELIEFPDILSSPKVSVDIYNLLYKTHERIKSIKKEERKSQKA